MAAAMKCLIFMFVLQVYIVQNGLHASPDILNKLKTAYKHADGKKIDGKRVLVDVERARTVKGWLPRRLNKPGVVVAKTESDAKAGNAQAKSKDTVLAFGKEATVASQSNSTARSDETGEYAHASAAGSGEGALVVEKKELTEIAGGKASKTVDYGVTVAGVKFEKSFTVPVKSDGEPEKEIPKLKDLFKKHQEPEEECKG